MYMRSVSGVPMISGKKLLIVITLLIFSILKVSAEEQDILEQKVAKVREEISLTNLINGLNLTEAQLSDIIGILREAQEMRKTYKEKHQTTGEELLKSFEDLKKALGSGANLPPEIEKRAGMLNEHVKELVEEFQKKLPSFQQRVENILTEAQKLVIDDFKPCLLPPKSQRNPVRAGQAKSNEHAIELLRRLREVPQDVYEQKRGNVLERYFTKFEEKKGKLTEEEREKEKTRLFSLVDSVRNMSAEDFEIEKNDLAEKFIIKDKAEELEKQLKDIFEYRNKDKGGMNRIGRFFLRPEMLSILETRLTNLKNFNPSEPADLDNIKTEPENRKPSKNR